MNTCLGAFLSLMVIFATFIYGYKRLLVLQAYEDTSWNEKDEPRQDSSTYYMQVDTNFNFAFGLAE